MEIKKSNAHDAHVTLSDLHEGDLFRFTDDVAGVVRMRDDEDGYINLANGVRWGLESRLDDEVILVNGYFVEK